MASVLLWTGLYLFHIKLFPEIVAEIVMGLGVIILIIDYIQRRKA